MVGNMGQFSAFEQFFLELVNRARMNPAGEAARFGISLNQGLASGTISSSAKQVLAPNSLLHDAAKQHSAHMLDVDEFAHDGIGDGTMPDRINSTGYDWFTIGENIAWTSQNSIALHHQNLFKSAGHRENILGSSFKEVGIGSTTGTFIYSGSTWAGSLMTTQNFGTAGSANFVTGVSYTDTTIDDNFYTVGEGKTGRTVELYQDGVLKTSTNVLDAGGYALASDLAGKVEIVFSGAELANEKGAIFTLNSSNVKIDMVDGSTIDTNVSIALTRGATHAHLLGIGNISAVGNSAANSLYGNAGSNGLSGKAGRDKLYGGSGNDTLVGGAGADYLSGSSGADKFKYYSAGDGGDKISSFSSSDYFVFEGSEFGLGDYEGKLSASKFRSGSGSMAADVTDRFIFRTTDDTLWYDSNGSTAGGTKVLIADIQSNAVVTAADILIV